MKKIFLVYAVLYCGSFCIADAVNIYMPREIQINQNRITLGQVCIITGSPELKEQISAIELGSISVAGQEIIINRGTIITRLVSSGISKKEFNFSGSDAIKVKGQSVKVTVKEYLTAAENLMQKHFTDKGCKWLAISFPKSDEVFDSTGAELRLEAEFDNINGEYQKRVIVKVIDGNSVIDSKYIVYQMKYKCMQAVASENISKGQLFAAEFVKIEEAYRPTPESGNFTPPYGMVAKRNIKAGDVITAADYESPKPVKIIKRNETVLVNIETQGFKLAVPGEALQDGFDGDIIKVKVKVTEETRTIAAKVKNDGTVEPII